MILFVLFMYAFFFGLGLCLGFTYGRSMGLKSVASAPQFWKDFFTGAAKIYAWHAIAAAALQLLVSLDGGFLVSFGMFLLVCAIVPVYAAIIWLPVYAFCFWDTRRFGLKEQTA